MSKPLIVRNDDFIIISYNGRKLVEPIDKYKGMSDEEILDNFIRSRNIKSINKRV